MSERRDPQVECVEIPDTGFFVRVGLKDGDTRSFTDEQRDKFLNSHVQPADSPKVIEEHNPRVFRYIECPLDPAERCNYCGASVVSAAMRRQ